ncbi:MAG: TonB-dependent receptor [Bacteroidales bacterium]|nr:TonB-dependent receptor [Bacteroidales bacterium]
MKKIIYIFFASMLFLQAQAQNSIQGKVTDTSNQTLTGVNVFFPELNKGTTTNSSGEYLINNLPLGKHKIEFSFVGYNMVIKTIDIEAKQTTINAVLSTTIVESQEVVISGGYVNSQHENAVKIDVLQLKPTSIKSTPNFTEMLSKVPGVDMISKGSGVAKPVIRGLSMNDILVLNNGVRFENYQYSSHHPLGIDEFGIENVEIIKGPASLLYGSDAIGGVINFIKEKPAPVGSILGDYNLQLFSNTQGITNNLGIKGASKKVFGAIRFGQKSNADFLQGGGEFVPNSRFNENSLKANAGFTGKLGTFKVFYDYNTQKLGLVEDEAIEEISSRGRKNEIWFQQFNTHLLSSQNKIYLGNTRLDLNAAYQNTELTHIGDFDVFELQMRLETVTYEAKLHLPSNENSEYILGFQGFNQVNTNINDRETILLPNASSNNYSAFALMQLTFFEKLKLQTGIRYDAKSIHTQSVGIASENNYRAALDKEYGSFSGSMGATYQASQKLLFRFNYAAGYRTPNLAELTSNGQHELRYELGDQNLTPENSYEADLSMHFHQSNFTFDLAGFYHVLNDYIFIAPTGESTISGIPIYQYKQTNSFLYGGETGLHFHPIPLKWLHLISTFSTVIGKQQDGDYLPFIPAHKLRFELRAEKERFLIFNDAYISMNTCTAFKQDNAAPDETPTASYSLLDVSIGGKIKLNNQFIYLILSANNLFDEKYIDHLSTLKEVNFYNPGRNIALSLKIPFELTKN